MGLDAVNLDGDKPQGTLLLINYSMNSSDPIFAHQIEVVRRLSKSFHQIFVITTNYSSSESLPENINVYEVEWIPGRHLTSARNFLRTYISLTRNLGHFVIFSHMTEVQSALIAVLAWWKKIPHYLWYAHKSKSPYLYISYPFLTGIITSTPGSCPIRGKKVSPIGQGIDESIFLRDTLPNYNPKRKLRGISVGRIDPSKKIEEIISVTVQGPHESNFEKLDLFGEASIGNSDYYRELLVKYSSLITDRLLNFHGKVIRRNLPLFLAKADIFVHAFRGSLDKTLVEATMMGVPVITANPEYINEFGSWSRSFKGDLDLESEMSTFLGMNEAQIQDEVINRQKCALEKHSLSGWTSRLLTIIDSSNA